jgi:hypothetical protein
MPDIYVDVDVDDFLECCSKKDIEDIITYLVEDGTLHKKSIFTIPQDGSLLNQEISETLLKISKHRLQLTLEEEETLKKIANRF